MTHYGQYLVFLLLLSTVVKPGLAAPPAKEPQERPDEICPSCALARDYLPLNSALGAKQRHPRMIQSDPVLLVRLTTRTENEVDSEVLNATVQVRSAEVTLDTDPQCLLHHEYAEILSIADPAADPRVKLFVNRHNEIRYYICLPCRLCPPGVRILSPCHRKRDTVCSSLCIHPDHVYDPVRQTCDLPTTPSDESLTRVPSSIAPTTHWPLLATLVKVFVREGSGIDDINQEVYPRSTSVPTSTSSLWGHITAITIGVMTLNVLVVVGVGLLYKRFALRRRYPAQSRGCINNALKLSQSSNPNNLSDTEVQSSVSRSNQLDSGMDQITSVNELIPAPLGTVPSLGPLQANRALSPLPSQQTQECNLNVFHEPLEQGDAVVPMTPRDDERPTVQVLRGKDPFWLVMIGRFGPEGGVLSCEDSDVILEIPPGAIPADRRDQLIVARVSLRPDSVGPKLKDPDSLWITPLVEFESPGLERFDKTVRMRLPHCASIQPGWTFRVHYTNPTSATKSDSSTESACQALHDHDGSNATWFDVHHSDKSAKRSVSVETGDGVTLTVDKKFINVSTTHFSKYCCSGCHKEHPLHLEAVVYWNHTKVEDCEQVNLKVYIVDPIKDARKMVDINEKSRTTHTGYTPLTLRYKKKHIEASPLEICVQENSMGDDWKWRLDSFNGCFPAKRVIPIQSLIRCCSPLLPTHQTFSFRPKASTGTELLSLFQTVISIKQPAWTDAEHILVTARLVQDRIKFLTETDANKEGTIITNEQIEFVVDQLPVKKFRPLYRRLIGDGADTHIEHIVARHQDDTREQIHEGLVSWRRSKGHQATPGELGVALEGVGEVGMAESLLTLGDADDLKELVIHDTGRQKCKVTTV